MMLSQREDGAVTPPPHRWDEETDAELPPLALVRPGTRIDAARPAAVMSSSFGFGGSNCALVIGDVTT
jgi:3-oxoacyl-[acyl-carrier-protein] synthase-1